MPQKPDFVPGWTGTDPAAPSDERRLAGWLFGDSVPASALQWFWRGVSSWIDYLNTSTVVKPYTSLGTALDELADGETALVDEYDQDDLRFTSRREGGPTATGVWCVASSGQYIVMGDTGGGTFYVYHRDDLANQLPTPVSVLSISAGTIVNVAVDDTHVYIASTSRVRKIPIDDLTNPTWTYDVPAGTPINDMCVSNTHVIVAGDSGVSAGADLIALDTTDGSLDWDVLYGVELYAVCTDGRQVYAAGERSGDANGSLLAYSMTGSLVWESVLAQLYKVAGPRTLCTDGSTLYSFAPGIRVHIHGCGDGVAYRDTLNGFDVLVVASPGVSYTGCALDDEHLYGVGEVPGVPGDYRLVVRDRRTLCLAYKSDAGDDSGVAVDACGLWTDGGDALTGRLRLHRNANHMVMIRKAPSAPGRLEPFTVS